MTNGPRFHGYTMKRRTESKALFEKQIVRALYVTTVPLLPILPHLFGLAPRPPLELAAETPLDVAITAGPTVLTCEMARFQFTDN